MKKILWLGILSCWSYGHSYGHSLGYSGTDLIDGRNITIPADHETVINTPIPIAGTIDGNNTGTLTLNGDAYLGATSGLINGIKINGNNKTLHLLGNNTLATRNIIFINSSLIIDGHNNIVDLNGTRFYINGESGTTLTLKNMTLYGLRGVEGADATFRFSNTIGQKVILENVTLYLIDNCTFTGGALDISGTVSLIGDYHFKYRSSADCTIKKASTLQLDMHVTFDYEPADLLATHLKFTDLTSTLFLRGGTLFVPSNTGLNLIKGHLVVDHKSYAAQNWISPNFGTRNGRINMGDGRDIANNMAIDILPGGQLITQAAALNYGIVDAS